MKFIAPFFVRRERKPNPALERVVTPTQTLVASVVVFAAALWPMVALRFGHPTSWLGHFLFLLCATLSAFTAPSLCIATFWDVVRRRADARMFVAFLLSLAGVAAIAAFIYLRIHQYDHAA